MYISKEEAKKIIDNAPDKIWVDSFNGITFIHTKPRQISKTEGCILVSQLIIRIMIFLVYYH